LLSHSCLLELQLREPIQEGAELAIGKVDKLEDPSKRQPFIILNFPEDHFKYKKKAKHMGSIFQHHHYLFGGASSIEEV
jgi:hypothetical protein